LPTLSGEEEPAIRRMADAFALLDFSTELRPVSPTIKADPDYACLEENIVYEGRHNLIVRPKNQKSKIKNQKSILLQTHLDVVPAGDWAEAFTPCVERGVVYGRGACDC